MHIGLLGDLTVVSDGREVAISGTRLQVLLTELALAAPNPVSPSALAVRLWPDGVPAEMLNALQSLVSRLRRALGDAALVTQSAGGYALAVSRADIDVHEFSRLSRKATAEFAAADLDAAARSAGAALALWRGDPAAELGLSLTEQYLSLRGILIQARLDAGEGAGLIAELDELIVASPLRESFVEQKMRALAAAGRQPEALAGYDRLRTMLADELGVDPSPRLRELHLALLRGELEPRPARVDTLPAALTSFIGRDAEVSQIAEMLDAARLITLLGPGGAGKTRLAIEAARSLSEPAVAVWLVELAPVSNPADVAHEVYDRLGVREAALRDRARGSAGDVVDRIADALKDRRTILILDNCEHVLEAAAQLAVTLLARCPLLQIVTTSREPLDVLGESLLPVSSLAEVPAMRLFADRAAAVCPGFTINETVFDSVAEIVRRLDGLPLAIELAAARMRTLTAAQIASRLSDRFGLLTSGNRAAAARHRTLRAVVDWSWELLDADERSVVECLAVFSGTISSEAAAGVCEGITQIDSVLTSLVDKSLLQLVNSRFRMLETIREYGLQRLESQGKLVATRVAHARYFAGLAHDAAPRIITAEQLPWLALLEVEQPNILAAVQFSADSGHAQDALDIVSDLSWYWMMMGRHAEIVTWFQVALNAHGARRADSVLLAQAYSALNSFATGTDARDPAELAQLHDKLANVTAEDPPMLVLLRPLLGMFASGSMAVAQDEAVFADALNSPDPWVAALVRCFRASVAENDGNLASMRHDAEVSLAQFRALGERWGQANSLQALAQLDQIEGDLAAAAAEYREALRLTAELGVREDQVLMRLRLAEVLTRQGQTGQARAEVAVAEELMAESPGGPIEMIFVQIFYAELALSEGRLVEARQLQQGFSARMLAMPETVPIRSRGVALSIAVGAKIELAVGDLTAARTCLEQAYEAALEARDMPILAVVGVSVARLALDTGQASAAATILGACAQLRGSADDTNLEIAALTSRLRAQLPTLQADYAAGRALWREAAITRVDPSRLDGAQARRR